jgi:outer membrane receptor protein involved in Fe transport
MPYARLLSTFHAGYELKGLNPTVGFDPLWITDIYLGVRDRGGDWEAQFWIKNLFDTVVVDYASPTDVTSGNNLYDSGYKAITENPPREIGFTVRYNF